MERLVGNGPVRKLQNSRRCLTGMVDLKAGGTASFESSLERDWLLVLDFDPSVRRIIPQPFTLCYDANDARRRYTPDVLVERVGVGFEPSTIVYEIKPRDELRASWNAYRRRFKAAMLYCRELNWRFKIVTEREIRTPLLENAQFLKRYRSVTADELATEQLLYTLRGLGTCSPQALLAAAYWHQEAQMGALPTLWRLVAERQIGAVLHERLTMRSLLWLPTDR